MTKEELIPYVKEHNELNEENTVWMFTKYKDFVKRFMLVTDNIPHAQFLVAHEIRMQTKGKEIKKVYKICFGSEYMALSDFINYLDRKYKMPEFNHNDEDLIFYTFEDNYLIVQENKNTFFVFELVEKKSKQSKEDNFDTVFKYTMLANCMNQQRNNIRELGNQ